MEGAATIGLASTAVDGVSALRSNTTDAAPVSEIAEPFEQRPNIVQIVVDDLGWADLGCYGSEFHETPNIDRLAEEGTRFTDAYAASPICSPTRASLYTGQSPPRHGITDWIGAGRTEGKERSPVPEESLSPETPTTARLLSDADYRTYHLGKWHVTDDKADVGPTDLGFDVNVGGSDWGRPMNGYFCPFGEGIPNLDCSDDDYLTDRLTDEAIDLIGDDSEPYFLNMAYYAVHTPIQAPSNLIQRFETKRRETNLPENPIVPGARFALGQKKNGRISRRTVQSDPTYAAMLYRLDQNIGRLLRAVESSDRPTVIIFHSDNGGLSTAEGSPTANDPLAEGKGWGYGGGIRVPTIVRWPGEVGGDTNETPIITQDLYVTALRTAGVDIPDNHIVDGRDIRPLIHGDSINCDALYWHYPHYSNQGGTPVGAIRYGNYKLLEFYEDEHVELYNLETDMGESIDLSNALPELTSKLRARLDDWQARLDAEMPVQNPDFEPWPERKQPGRSYEWQPDRPPRTTPDKSSSRNTGSVVGDGTLTAGQENEALRFDGSTGVDLPHSDSLEVINPPLTVEAWINPSDPKDGGKGFEPYVTKGQAIQLHRAAQDALANGQVGAVIQSSQDQYYAPHAPIPENWTGTWHHLALVWDGSTLHFYLDGQEGASQSFSGTIKSVSSSFAVGANLYKTGTSRYVADGTIVDSVRIHRKALPPDDLGYYSPETTPINDKTILWLDFEELNEPNSPPDLDAPPAVVGDSKPTDPDGDGLYEDIDGDGKVTDDDGELFFEHIDDPEMQDNVEAFDFNDNGRLDFDDIVEWRKKKDDM